MNSAASPEAHKLFAQALNSGDLDALVALYAFDGFLMARSGPARGVSAIRKALAGYVAMKPTIQLTTRRVVQAEDTALLVADWRFHGTASDGGCVSTSGTCAEGIALDLGSLGDSLPQGEFLSRDTSPLGITAGWLIQFCSVNGM